LEFNELTTKILLRFLFDENCYDQNHT